MKLGSRNKLKMEDQEFELIKKLLVEIPSPRILEYISFVLSGATIEQITELTCVTHSTARNQLMIVYGCCGVKSYNELQAKIIKTLQEEIKILNARIRSQDTN